MARRPNMSAIPHARVVIGERNEVPANEPGLQALAKVDAGFSSRTVCSASEQHSRLVLSPALSLTADTDDVRRVGDAAASGAAAAFAMGAHELTLVIDETIESTSHPIDGPHAYRYAALVAQLAVLQRAYVPLQEREAEPSQADVLTKLDVHPGGEQTAASAANAIEAGRTIARDIGSGDPERMTPLRLAESVREACAGTGVDVQVIDDVQILAEDYPLMMAVARASMAVERHWPCVVRMSWSGRGEIKRTVCIAGKGVTYDVGGYARTTPTDSVDVLSLHVSPDCLDRLNRLDRLDRQRCLSRDRQGGHQGRWIDGRHEARQVRCGCGCGLHGRVCPGGPGAHHRAESGGGARLCEELNWRGRVRGGRGGDEPCGQAGTHRQHGCRGAARVSRRPLTPAHSRAGAAGGPPSTHCPLSSDSHWPRVSLLWPLRGGHRLGRCQGSGRHRSSPCPRRRIAWPAA